MVQVLYIGPEGSQTYDRAKNFRAKSDTMKLDSFSFVNNIHLLFFYQLLSQKAQHDLTFGELPYYVSSPAHNAATKF